MKRIFEKFATIMSAMAITLAFTACEKENGKNNGDGDGDTDKQVIESISTSYSLEFSEDLLKFYDINVNYGTDAGVEKSQKITSTKWSATHTYGKSELPASVFCKAVMTPKADRPAIDPEGIYTVTKNKDCKVSATYTNGNTSTLNIYENSSTSPAKGQKFEEYINKGERVMCDYSYTIRY